MDRKWLRDRLKESGLNQTNLAAILGIRNAAISDIYNDKRALTFDEAWKISGLLNCTVEELYAAYKKDQSGINAYRKSNIYDCIADVLDALKGIDSNNITSEKIAQFIKNLNTAWQKHPEWDRAVIKAMAQQGVSLLKMND